MSHLSTSPHTSPAGTPRVRLARGQETRPPRAQRAKRDDKPLADSLRPRGPVQLEVVQEDRQGRTILHARGEVDVMTAPKLSAQLDSVLRSRDNDVTVDLTETTFLDSAGLHVLLNAARRLTRCSRHLTVLCGPGPVRHVIELARLVETLGVSDP